MDIEEEDNNDQSIKPERKSFVSRLQFFENNISTSDEDLLKRRCSIAPAKNKQAKQNRLSYNYNGNSNYSSIQDVENRPNNSVDLKSRKLSDNGLKTVQNAPIPARRNIPNLTEIKEIPTFSTRSWSLRRKPSPLPPLFQNQSLFNISNLDKSVASSPLARDLTYSRTTLSMTKTGSMVSLFEEEVNNSIIVDYSMDWKAIFEKISEKTSNDIENELLNYFHNSNIDLKLFPISCLYRYLTFDDVLEIVFNDILTSDCRIDFNEDILKTSTKTINIDYDFNSYDVTKLIKCNVKNLEQMLNDYNTRNCNLDETLKELKETLAKFLMRPENLTKLHREIDNIYIKFQRLSDVLILIITSMSTWKLCKDFPHLFENKRCEATTVKTCEIIFTEFLDSQKKLQEQIIKLFKQFNEENATEVLQLFDQLFSEILEVSICLPIFKDKIRKDNQVLSVLESSNKVVTRKEQFV